VVSFLIAATTEQSWLDYASRIGVIGILVISHYGFHKRWWVWGREHDDLVKRHELLRQRCAKMEDEKESWKESALTGGRIAAGATQIARTVVAHAESEGSM
jgi:hypothetical protein